MTRNMIIGWALLVALFLGWTQYKGHQARELQQQRTAEMKKDSVEQAARLAANPPSETAPGAASENGAAKAQGKPGETVAPVTDAGVQRRLVTVKTPRFTAVLDARGGRIAELRVPSLEGK